MRRNVLLLYGYTCCIGLIFLLPVMLPYYRDIIGLGFKEFMIGEALFAFVIIVLEIPSGWLSDVWKRKHVLSLAALFHVVGYAFLMFADSFADTLIAQAVLGVTISLISGTRDALLYDTLLEENHESAYRKIEGQRFAIGKYSVALATFSGGALYVIWPYLPLVLGVVASAVAGIFSLFLKEPVRHNTKSDLNPIQDMLVTVKYAWRGHKEIAGLILLGAVLFSGTKLVMWSQQPYYIFQDIPEYLFGVFMGIGFLAGGLAGQFGHRILPNISNRAFLFCLTIWIGVICIAISFIPYYLGIILLLSGSILFGLGLPRQQDAINKRVESRRRATILSAASFAGQFAFIPLSILLGMIEGYGGITLALLCLGIWAILAGGASYRMTRDTERP